ncbi:hypothetical protein KX928_23595 [Roseobacter sp. YSTF-M11]|uniref:Uncharacterized protein n=1 Tax=Roseobacter insulae TaxID=2859783 RepID=A0A9X1G055_9RHOB|nr:hypothetical protein [Roseobacter insulae]MBW4710786.1 hypothetical protein [Roseobacter insulae]
MADKFKSFNEGLNSPPSRLAAVTPSDTADIPQASRCINVATSGAVRLTTIAGDTETIFVAAGIVFPIRAARIWSTGTTATGIMVMY